MAQSQAQAPEDAPFGKFAWPDKRQEDLPEEEDTPSERKMYRALNDAFASQFSKLTDEESNLIQTVMKNGWYPKVFAPPRVNTVIRGMIVPKKWLQDALGKEDISSKGDVEHSFTFNPRGGASSSWTRSYKVAQDFSIAAGKQDAWGVIMAAHTADNPNRFLDCTRGIYGIEGLDMYDSEKEIIGLGPIKVFRVRWIDRSTPMGKRPADTEYPPEL